MKKVNFEEDSSPTFFKGAVNTTKRVLRNLFNKLSKKNKELVFKDAKKINVSSISDNE